jgi:hypothetical protein
MLAAERPGAERDQERLGVDQDRADPDRRVGQAEVLEHQEADHVRGAEHDAVPVQPRVGEAAEPPGRGHGDHQGEQRGTDPQQREHIRRGDAQADLDRDEGGAPDRPQRDHQGGCRSEPADRTDPRHAPEP